MLKSALDYATGPLKRSIDENIRAYLEKFIDLDNFNQDGIDFDINGNGYSATYRNLSIRNQSIDMLPWPAVLMHGQVEEIKVIIPSVFSGISN